MTEPFTGYTNARATLSSGGEIGHATALSLLREALEVIEGMRTFHDAWVEAEVAKATGNLIAAHQKVVRTAPPQQPSVRDSTDTGQST